MKETDRRLCAILLALTIAALLILPRPATRAQPKPPDGPAVVRLIVRDRDHLNAVAGELDVWELYLDAGYVVAAVWPEQIDWLVELGYTLEVDDERTAHLSALAALDPRFYYFDTQTPNPNGRYVVSFLQDIDDTYPHLTELFDIGDTWQGTRDVLVLRVTNEDPAFGPIEDKPAFFLIAAVHAREVATPELAIRYIRYLTEGYAGAGGYGIDPDVTWLVDHNVAYVLVMQNPDGHAVNTLNTSAYRRKNMNDTLCHTGNFGVDLNRNSSFMWSCCGGSSENACNETYRGTHPGSEPETQAFEAFFASVMRDQNGPNDDDEIPLAAPDDATGIFFTLHSYGDMTLWPWGFGTYGQSPNYTQHRTIGRKLAYYTGYTTFSIWYDVDGATDDWTYGKFGIASFTFEVGPNTGSCGGFFPAYECIDGAPGYPRNFWAETRPAFIYAHKIARTPYMTAYGPDTLNVTVTPLTVEQGAAVELTATVSDQRLAGDTLRPVAAAEYFIGAPGADGSGVPMAPVDGAWGGLSEDVVATIDTSGLAPGRHYVLVHGRNDLGDWGPFTAAFLTVDPPVYAVSFVSSSPDLLGETTFFTSTVTPDGAALGYAWAFGDGVTSTLPAPTHTYAAVGAYPVTLTVETAAGFVSAWGSAQIDYPHRFYLPVVLRWEE